MKEFIIKSNEWYDDLPEPKRTLFFLALVLLVCALQLISLVLMNFLWVWIIFITLFTFWRMSYVMFNCDKK